MCSSVVVCVYIASISGLPVIGVKAGRAMLLKEARMACAILQLR